MAGVAFEQMSKVYRRHEAVDALTLRSATGVHGARRPVGLRQDDGAADGRRLEEITSGLLKIGERVVNNVPSRDRDIAMVFQS